MPPGNELLEILWSDLLKAMKELPPLEIIMPQERKTLCSCGSNWKEVYEAGMEQWIGTFWQEENQLLEYCFRIYWYFENHPGSRTLLNTTPGLKNNINEALKIVIERMATKLKRLADVYEDGNIYVEDALVYATMELNKELVEKISCSDPEQVECRRMKKMAYTLIDQIANLVVKKKIFEKYIQEQKRLKNFNVVFDYSLYMSHETNKELLNGVSGSMYSVPETYSRIWVEGLKNYNRFKLKMDMDFELHDGDDDDLYMVADGILESAEIIVSMGRVYPCKWHLYLTQSDYRNKNADEEKYYVPFTVRKGIKTYPKVPLGTYNYTGPATMKMVFPIFKFSFCNNTQNDSAVLQILRYSDRDLQAYPRPDYAHEYSTDMLAYANKMLIGIMKTKQEASALTNLSASMMNVSQVTSPLAPTGNAVLDRMIREFFINQHRLDLQTQLSEISHTTNTVILFDAVNESADLIKQPQNTVDATDADRNVKIRLVRGEITVKVKHAPL